MEQRLLIETASQLRKRIIALGFRLDRKKGSHEQYICEKGCHTITLAVHSGKDVYKSDIRSIIRQSGCSKEDFYNGIQQCYKDEQKVIQKTN